MVTDKGADGVKQGRKPSQRLLQKRLKEEKATASYPSTVNLARSVAIAKP